METDGKRYKADYHDLKFLNHANIRVFSSFKEAKIYKDEPQSPRKQV